MHCQRRYRFVLVATSCRRASISPRSEGLCCELTLTLLLRHVSQPLYLPGTPTMLTFLRFVGKHRESLKDSNHSWVNLVVGRCCCHWAAWRIIWHEMLYLSQQQLSQQVMPRAGSGQQQKGLEHHISPTLVSTAHTQLQGGETGGPRKEGRVASCKSHGGRARGNGTLRRYVGAREWESP